MNQKSSQYHTSNLATDSRCHSTNHSGIQGVSRVPRQPLSFVSFGRFSKSHSVHSTTQSKTIPSTQSFSEHRCDNCNWAVLEDLLLKRNKPRKTNLIYRNRCMNGRSFHKKPTATDQSWQGALITSLKYKTWVSGNSLYGKNKLFSRWAILVIGSTRKTSRVTNNIHCL